MLNTATMMVAVLATATLLGCRPASDKVPKADNPPRPQVETSARAGNGEDRTNAQQKLSQQLNDLDAKMADLKARAQRAGDQAKVEWEARRPQLEAQRETAGKKLQELKQSGKETWEQTRTKTEAAFAEVEKGFKEAWTKLKE